MGLASTLDWLQLQMLAPHGVCLTWSSPLIWTYVVSDSLIALSYFSIPFALFYFIRKRKDIAFSSVFVMFGLFISACGATHVMDVWKLWNPNYWSDAILRQFTAGISLGTAVMLWVVMPKALAIPSTLQLKEKNDQLETEVKQREVAEALFRSAFEYAPIGIAMVTPEGNWLDINKAICHMFGYDKTTLLGSSLADITHPDDQDIDQLLIKEMLRRERDSYTIEKRYLHQDGGTVWVVSSFSAIYHKEGSVQHFITQIRDISEQKRMSEKLKESEAQFRSAFNNAPTGIATFTMDGEFLAINDALCDILGYDKAELLATSLQDVTHPDDFNLRREALEQLNSGKIDSTSYEKRYIHKNGQTIWVQLHISTVKNAYDEPQYLISHVVDISPSIQARTALETSESLFKGVFTQSGVGMALVSAEGRWSLVNDRLCEILGYDEQELEGKSFLELTHADDIDEDRSLFDSVHRGQLDAFHFEKRFLHASGRTIWTVTSVTVVRKSKGQVDYFINQVIDISGRKQAEQALAHSETQLRNILDTIAEGIIVQTEDGEILEFNANMEKIMGLSKEQFINPALRDPRWKALNEDGSVTARRAIARRTLETGQPQSSMTEIHKPDGEITWILANAIPFELADQSSKAVVSSLTDITEMRQANQALKDYATRLEQSNRDLQDFAYVASHDLQEPLRMVSSFVQLLEKRYGQHLDETANSYISFAVDGAKRMQILINNLLEYSRVDSKGKSLMPVSSQVALDQALLNLSVRIEESKAEISHDDLPLVLGDDGQLSQVFQNLIANAIKFHGDERPKIHIGVSRIVEARESFWRFTLQDNGIGMPKESLERIFTIFQRLHGRDTYEGTGIGLAICRRIIERHRGKIWAESSPGKGTTFYFTLPAVSDRSVPKNGSKEQSESHAESEDHVKDIN